MKSYVKELKISDIRSQHSSGEDWDNLEIFLNTEYGQLISSFVLKLEEEIKKFHKGYTEIERGIYDELNKHLRNETKYP